MVKSLPYGPDDDTAAEVYVRESLRRSGRGNWPALLTDERVVQTYRVLRRIQSAAIQNHVHHRGAFTSAEADRDAGVISAECYAEKYRQYADWRERAAAFDGVLRQYLDMAVDRVRVIRADPVVESLRHVLLTLAIAVEEHREAHTGEESLADTALWARLRLLPWPTTAGAERRVLADAVAAERARQGGVRWAEHDVIQFEGHLVAGATVHVVAMLLALTDHTRPACSPADLVALWRGRTTAPMGPAASGFTTTHTGSYIKRHVHKALRLLEDLGLITRAHGGVHATVLVTHRARLVELRRHWDDTHFGLDDLET